MRSGTFVSILAVVALFTWSQAGFVYALHGTRASAASAEPSSEDEVSRSVEWNAVPDKSCTLYLYVYHIDRQSFSIKPIAGVIHLGLDEKGLTMTTDVKQSRRSWSSVWRLSFLEPPDDLVDVLREQATTAYEGRYVQIGLEPEVDVADVRYTCSSPDDPVRVYIVSQIAVAVIGPDGSLHLYPAEVVSSVSMEPLSLP